MSLLSEKILKNTEVCKELGVSDYERKQLIARGLLDSPIDTGGAYPKHSLSQVIRAKERIRKEAQPPARPSNAGKKTRPLSRKMISSLRGYR